MDALVKRLAAVDLNLIVSLHVLLRFGSVTAAARHLGLTQSTMSHQLARLRELLQDEVLVRRGNRMEPTARAVALASTVGKSLVALHDAVLEPPRFDPAAAQGDLVIAMTDWAAIEYAPNLVAMLAREAPALRLRVAHPMVDETRDALDWDVDLAVVWTTEPLPADRARSVMHERFVGVARSDHPFCAAPPDTAAFLAADKLVVHAAPLTTALDAELDRHLALSDRAVLHVPYFLAVPPLLRNVDLVAVLPSIVAQGLAEDHALGTFEIPIPLPIYHVSLAWSPLRAGDPRITWLVERISGLVDANLKRRRHATHPRA